MPAMCPFSGYVMLFFVQTREYGRVLYYKAAAAQIVGTFDMRCTDAMLTFCKSLLIIGVFGVRMRSVISIERKITSPRARDD
jgi:hypothetical protein